MIQFDYPNGGIGKKDRKRYTFSDFRGVDKSVAEINVAPNHAVESTNFVDRNGVLHKRYGWEQVYQFEGEINGFWELYLDGVNYTICYAGTTFYRKTKSGWETLYTNDKLVSRRTYCHVQKDKAYFIGCGDFLVFRLDVDSGKYAIFRVYDDTETYVPTTTAQISPTDMVLEGVGKQYVRDGVNLLTGWRKNTLVGAVIPDENGLHYHLDSKPYIDSNYNAKLTIKDEIFECAVVKNGEVILDYGTVEVDLSKYMFSIQGKSISLLETVKSDIPFVKFGADVNYGEYCDWVLKIEGDKGVACGLRWKKEDKTALTKKVSSPNYNYYIYTLYLYNENGEREVPIYRDYQRIAGYSKAESLEFSEIKFDFKIEGSNVTITANRTKALEINYRYKFDLLISFTHDNSGGIPSSKFIYDFTIEAGEETGTRTIELVSNLLTVTANSIQRASKSLYHNNSRVFLDIVEQEYEINLPEIEDYSGSFSSFFKGRSPILKENNFLEGKEIKLLTITSDVFEYNDENLDLQLQPSGYLHIKKWDIEDIDKKNVSIQFYVSNDIEQKNVTQAKYSTLYGVGEEANRLFVANGDKGNSNIIFFSEMDDFTYFPDKFTKAVGGNNNEIKGFIRLANGSMAALKSLNGNEPTVFVFNGEYISGYYDAEQTEPYTLPKFSTSGVSTTQGIIAPYACSNLADDSLFLSQNGIYALELSQGTDSQRFAKERSLPINNLLKECNLSELQEACAITHENKYYLAVPHYKRTLDTSVKTGKTYYEKVDGSYVETETPDADTGMSKYYEREDCVYVADAHYTFKPMGAMADTFSYEWYPLINIPVRTWFSIDGVLYFGTNDGRICKFIENQYYDVEKLYLASDVESAEIKAYSQKQVKAITTALDTNADGNIDTFSIDEHTEIEDGDTIIFTSGNLLGNVYGEVADLLKKELYIVKAKNDKEDFLGNIQLKYTPDGEVIEFAKAENLTATIQKKTIVKASRTMPTFDFGMPDYLKTLESFTITMNGVDGGYALLDIHTRNNRIISQNVKGQSHYDSLNGFSKASFNVPFQNSFTKKIMIRNFNYAIFKIENDMPVDCSVASISVMYKYNRASGGIK